MKRVTVITSIFMACLLLSACATVKVYSDAGLKNETGLRFYTLKPYLLVEYLAEKDNTVRTSVIYLPDLSDPQFVSIRPGIGSSELKMGFKNSALESYGVITDSQLAESMEAFAAILSKSAYAAQTFTGTGRQGVTDIERGVCFRLYEILPAPAGTALKEIVP